MRPWRQVGQGPHSTHNRGRCFAALGREAAAFPSRWAILAWLDSVRKPLAEHGLGGDVEGVCADKIGLASPRPSRAKHKHGIHGFQDLLPLPLRSVLCGPNCDRSKMCTRQGHSSASGTARGSRPATGSAATACRTSWAALQRVWSLVRLDGCQVLHRKMHVLQQFGIDILNNKQIWRWIKGQLWAPACRACCLLPATIASCCLINWLADLRLRNFQSIGTTSQDACS